jgi:cell division protease FtsH
LQEANNVARNMITRYGMSEKLSNLIFGSETDEIFLGKDFAHAKNYSEQMAAEIDMEVKNIIDSCYGKIVSVLRDNINKLNAVAMKLIEKEKIEGHEFEELFENA